MPTYFVFLRTKRFGKNRVRVYYYIVESFKVNGKPKQRVIKYIGTIQNLVGKLKIAEKCLRDHLKNKD
jgi:CHAD domain-containing protein